MFALAASAFANATADKAKADATEDWFTDATAAAGLAFTHFNGMSGELYYPEIMPPGVALFDYDNDGDLDLFVVQGRMLGSKPIDRAWEPPRDRSALGGHLFRNDLTVAADGRRTVHFTDVTEKTRIRAAGYAESAESAESPSYKRFSACSACSAVSAFPSAVERQR